MIIEKITVYAVKAGQPYTMAGGLTSRTPLPGSGYLRLGDYPQLYSRHSQAALVRVQTDEGIVGWGECQAPVGTEVILTLIAEVLGPALLGQDAEATAVRYTDMYESLRVRGQTGGFQLDAIAGLDTALWDVRGKAANRSLSDLLGGQRRSTLPCYVTGLRGSDLAARTAEASEWAERGIAVKACLGDGRLADTRELEALRHAVGDDTALFVDAMWQYDLSGALGLGRACDRLGIGFLESPLVPEDLDGHARLADKIDTPVAVGEPLRTGFAFLPWFQAHALAIAQPDQMRNGVTETVRIAHLAEAFHLPVALHTGCATVVGMSATWQIAATLPNFLIQEYQPVMLATFNSWLDRPLEVTEGQLPVPSDPGLGLTLDEERIAAEATSSVTVRL